MTEGHVFLFGLRRPGAAPPFGIRMLKAAKPPFCNALCTKETPAIDRRLFMFLEQAPLERLGTEKQGCSATI